MARMRAPSWTSWSGIVRDEALATGNLRRLFAGPSVEGPNELRDDPFFASLKADPRFEEILKSARPL